MANFYHSQGLFSWKNVDSFLRSAVELDGVVECRLKRKKVDDSVKPMVADCFI